eukprot:14551539-Ditylum_brightwellii.AAC.1
MGNTIASCFDCFNVETVEFDLLKYDVYCCIQLKKCNQECDQVNNLITKHCRKEDAKSIGKKKCAAKKRRRLCKKILLEFLDSGGVWQVWEPQTTSWYVMYILDLKVGDKKFDMKMIKVRLHRERVIANQIVTPWVSSLFRKGLNI